MITEDYVSFETAKLLKEKGFDARCPMIYTADGKLLYTDAKHHNMYAVTNKYLEYYTDIIAPSQTMAMKWLREEKHIFIELLVDTMIKGAFTWRLFEYPSLEIMPYDGWEYTYEEACESAIKYCLKILI